MKLLCIGLLLASSVAFADERPDGSVTLPDGALAAAAVVNAETRDLPAEPPATHGMRATTESLGIALAAGLTDEITAGLTYAVDLHDPDGSFPSNGRWKGPLLAHAELALAVGPRVFVAVGGDIIVHLENPTDRAFHLGVAASVRLSPSISIFTGAPLPNGPAGQQLAVALAKDGPITLAIPAGVLVRPPLPVYGFVETTLASLAITHATTKLLVSDFVPVEAGVFARARKDLDLGVVFSDDLEAPGALYTIGVAARYQRD